MEWRDIILWAWAIMLAGIALALLTALATGKVRQWIRSRQAKRKLPGGR